MIVECAGRRFAAVHADLARDLERELAEGDARIKELEGIVSGKTMFDAADAAVKAERERIGKLAEGIEALAHGQADKFGNYLTGGGMSGDYREGRADGYYHAAALIRAALSVIDKEGEGE